MSEYTAEQFVAVLEDAHNRGWSVGEIAQTLISWLQSEAVRALSLEELGSLDIRRIVHDRFVDIAEEISELTAAQRWNVAPDLEAAEAHIRELIADGLAEEVSPGEFRLTPAGEERAESLIFGHEPAPTPPDGDPK